MTKEQLNKRIRYLLIFFISALALSGITAFPLVWELSILNKYLGQDTYVSTIFPALSNFITYVNRGLIETDEKYPFLFYGTDWLAFAHIIIAIAFIGPFKDPVRNKWVIDFGIINCLLIFPLALIMGNIRGIPFFWQVLDCSFGILGLIPLLLIKKYIKQLEKYDH
ncbi:MAG: hypothetical protein IPP53_01535 [Bacteroidetes bacterium]|nr:hypothetical protein [Bacteroidota bacterium]